MAELSLQLAEYGVDRETATRNRSSAESLGARRRDRLMTRSCCFMSRLSATTALAPPGPMSLAIVVSRCARSISRSFMAEQGREDCLQEQVCLCCRFQVEISNSPSTRYAWTIIDGTRIAEVSTNFRPLLELEFAIDTFTYGSARALR